MTASLYRASIVALLMIPPALLQAQESPGSRWRLLVEDNRTPVMIDNETIQRDGSRVLVWLRLEYKVADPDAPKRKRSLTRQQYDCEKALFRIVEETHYDAAGKVLSRRSATFILDLDSQGWESVIPESVGEAIYQEVCKMRR